MRQWKVGTISMAVLFIALGVGMIYDRISGAHVIENVVSWWPVILVVLGFELLLYVFFSKRQHSCIKFDGFSMVIILVITVFCLSSYVLTRFFGDIFNVGIVREDSAASKFESSFTKAFTIDPGDKDNFLLKNAYGNIRVGKSYSKYIEIEADIKILNNDEKYAGSIYNSFIEVDDSNNIMVETKREQYLADRSRIQDISIDYYVKVPEGLNVEVENRYGKVSVVDAPLSVKVANTYGDVYVKSAAKYVTIDNSYSGVEVDGAGADIIINSRNGAVIAKNIMGNANIKNSYADISADNITGFIKAADNNGKIRINGVGGSLNIDSTYCDIDADTVMGDTDIKGSNGNITLRAVEGKALVTNRYGIIELVNAHNSVNLSNSSGKIFFEANRPVEKNVTIENEYDNINVNIPKIQQGSLRVFAKQGSIYNNLHLNIIKGDSEESVDQKLGEGSASINLYNKGGDIRIIGR